MLKLCFVRALMALLIITVNRLLINTSNKDLNEDISNTLNGQF